MTCSIYIILYFILLGTIVGTTNFEKAFVWKIDSAFGESCTSTDSNTIYEAENPCLVTTANKVEINHRMAVLIQAEQANSKITVKLTSDDNSQCLNIYVKSDQTATLYDSRNLLPTLLIEGEKVFIAVTEPNCKLYAEKNNQQDKTKMIHVFMQHIKTELLGFRFAWNPIHRSRVISSTPEVCAIENKKTDYNFYPFPAINEADKVECNSKCQYGEVISIHFNKKGFQFAHMFHLNSSCQWMSVMLDTSKSNEVVEISLWNSFVVFQREVRANAINFESGDHYKVGIAYYTENQICRVVVMNANGQAVKSSKCSASSPEIRFGFSNSTCLIESIGNVEDYGLHKFVNLGYNIATSKGKIKGYRYAKEPEAQAVLETYKDQIASDTNDQSAMDESQAEKEDDKINDDDYDHGHITETLMTINSSNTAPPTTPATISHASREIGKRIRDALQGNKYVTWGIPAGFFTGSFVSFIICNVLLFVFKRTVLNFWYKAMYKRYGSDTTMGAGTTMGKTMGGETVGGGSTTVGGTTMGGGTTAGETGSTTAA